MSKDVIKSSVIDDIKEKEQERYSFYKLDDLTHIVLTLMNAFESESYHSIGKLAYGHAVIEADKPTDKTKKVILDTWLMNYIDLQLEYDQNDAILSFGFGPSDSRFKLNLPEEQELDYIQDFADVLYEYRSQHEIKELPYEELDDLLKKYLEISKEEIEIRKSNKTNNKTAKKSY